MNLSSALHHPLPISTPQESGLHFYFTAFINRWKLLLFLPLLFAIAAGLGSAFFPDVYKARTNILPRQMNQTNAAAMLSQANSLASNPGNALNIRIPIDPNVKLSSDLYVALLKSNSMADALIKRFSLSQYYGVNSLEKTRRLLLAKTAIRTTKEGLIDISVEDTQSEHAALLANAYVEELQKLLQKLELTDASQRRKFFEQRLQSISEKMTAAQAALNNVDSTKVPETIRLSSEKAETAAVLRAQISFKEIKQGATQAFLTGEPPQSDDTRAELTRLREKLTKFENDATTTKFEETRAPVKNVAGSELLQVLHDFKYSQTLAGLLEKEYQVAAADEAKEATSALRVVDRATPPELASYPNRLLVAVLAGLAGLLLAILVVLFFINAARTKQFRTR